MADHGGNGKDQASTSTTPSTKAPGGPLIQESQEAEEYQRALQTVVGTALGVILLVGLLALFFLLYRLRRQRHRARLVNGSQQQSPILQRSVSIDVGSKPVPSVLVLYAYDCAMHEAVVVALSGLLMEVCGVTVSLDVLEENVIMERGLEDWLEDRLQEADFIVVVCSLGARLRCSKKRVRFREEAGRIMPDYFAVAVDYVAEKLRVERSKGLGVGKFVSVVMDYSRLSDIPPQLEAASAFVLMKDFTALCAHLSSNSSQHKPPELLESLVEGEGEAWLQTEVGQEMWAAMGQARHYFKTNPNWLEDRLEPLPARARTKPRRRHRRHNRDETHDTPFLPLLPSELNSQSTTDLNSSANVVMHVQTLPPRPVGSSLAHSRQNSLPSSLSSTHHPPGSVQQSVSRSVDSFPPTQQPPGRDFGSLDGSCLLCQQQREGWGVGGGGRRVVCPLHPKENTVVTLSDTDGESELELGLDAMASEQRCSRSKSLPSVGRPLTSSVPQLLPLPTSHTAVEGFTNNAALSGSRTILQAEVHKEWGAHSSEHRDREGGGVEDEEEEKREPDPPPLLQSAPRVWDLNQVPDAPKEWDSVMRPCGRVSPSSVSSDSSASSAFSANHSGSDSLERDLRSITMPRIFDHTADSLYQLGSLRGVTLPQLHAVTPLRSQSSSALGSVVGGGLNPVPCLTPMQPLNHAEFNFDFSPIRWGKDGDLCDFSNSNSNSNAQSTVEIELEEKVSSPKQGNT